VYVYDSDAVAFITSKLRSWERSLTCITDNDMKLELASRSGTLEVVHSFLPKKQFCPIAYNTAVGKYGQQ